jgi:hypothetical protein
MEYFFTPARRLQHEEIYERGADEDDELLPFEFTEVQLAVPVEVFLNQSCDWSDFLTFLTANVLPTIVWISEDAFLSVDLEPLLECDQLIDCQSLYADFTAANGESQYMVLSKRTEPLSDGESSIFWHIVMASHCSKLLVSSDGNGFGLCSATVLSEFLGGSPWLQEIIFKVFVFKEDHCRALATLERTNLEISFEFCTIDAQDAEDVFIEWLRHSQVVTALMFCVMESSILSALRGNSFVKFLKCRTKGDEQCEDHLRSLAHVLPDNQGIEELDVSFLTHHPMSGETWNLLFRSLWTHPRIESVCLDHYVNRNRNFDYGPIRYMLSAESKADRMYAVLQMVRCNTVVREIYLPHEENDEEFYQNHILPRLEMNRSGFGEQRAALKRADPSIRGQLLGRALYVVRYNPDLLFRFLWENVPAFVRTEEEEEEEEEEEDVSVVPVEQDHVTVQNPIMLSGQKRKM